VRRKSRHNAVSDRVVLVSPITLLKKTRAENDRRRENEYSTRV